MSDLRAWTPDTNRAMTLTFKAGLGRLFARPRNSRLPVTRIEVNGEWIYATVKHPGAKRTYLWHRGQMALDFNPKRHELTVADRAQDTFSTRLLPRRAHRDLAVILTSW
jgi:hypothetical protein